MTHAMRPPDNCSYYFVMPSIIAIRFPTNTTLKAKHILHNNLRGHRSTVQHVLEVKEESCIHFQILRLFRDGARILRQIRHQIVIGDLEPRSQLVQSRRQFHLQ